MKIALIIQNADRRNGGAEQYTFDLARQLTARGHEMTLVAESGPPAVMQDAREAGFQCIYLGSEGRNRWKRLQDFMLRVRDLYERGAYDIVHAMMPLWRCDVYQPHSGLATDSWLNGHLKHRRWIVRRWARRFNRFNLKRRGLAKIEKHMMLAGTYVLCLSTAMCEFARKQFHVPAERLITLHNGIDLKRFDPAVGKRSRQAIREEWHVGDHQRLGLLVGHNWKLKGLHEAMEALQRLNASGDGNRIALMVVGRDDVALFEKAMKKLGVKNRLIFPGSVADPRPLYGAADFLLLPTRRDSCSLVVLEALAMGLPVITTRQNGASEVIEDGKQGIILERGDSAGLAQALCAMFSDDRLAAMGQAALALRPMLSIEHHIDRVEGIYREIMAERAGVVKK